MDVFWDTLETPFDIYIYMFWATFRCRQNGRQNLPDRPPIGMILDTPTEFSRGAPNRSSGGPVGAPNRSSGGPIGTSGARIWRSYRVCHFSIFIFLRAQGYSRLILRNSIFQNYAIFQNFAVLRARLYHRREKRPLQSMSDLNESFWDGLRAEIEEARPEFQGPRKSSHRA